ncbi:hypothetical protein ACLKA6_001301 [Drosophila palustris]
MVSKLLMAAIDNDNGSKTVTHQECDEDIQKGKEAIQDLDEENDTDDLDIETETRDDDDEAVQKSPKHIPIWKDASYTIR